MSKVFVAENGQKLVARDSIQAAAFKNAGLKEVKEVKK
jgi:hypothetical protein